MLYNKKIKIESDNKSLNESNVSLKGKSIAGEISGINELEKEIRELKRKNEKLKEERLPPSEIKDKLATHFWTKNKELETKLDDRKEEIFGLKVNISELNRKLLAKEREGGGAQPIPVVVSAAIQSGDVDSENAKIIFSLNEKIEHLEGNLQEMTDQYKRQVDKIRELEIRANQSRDAQSNKILEEHGNQMANVENNLKEITSKYRIEIEKIKEN